MEQLQRGFIDSTPRAGRDGLKTLETSLISALQLISISQINLHKYGSGHLDPFRLQEILVQ